MNINALYSAAVAGNAAIGYHAQVEHAMGKPRRFASTLPASAVISAGIRDSRPAHEVAAQLLHMRKAAMAQDRRANAELKQRMGW